MIIADNIIIPVVIFVDIFLFDHILETSYWWDCIMLTIVWVVYEIIAIFGVYVFDHSIYGNLIWRDISFGQGIVKGGAFYFLYIGMYLVYQFGLQVKMGVRFGSTTVTEKTRLV
ncbi:MAG: hypothetical protein MJ252_21290 [archaeon]|nr:hypothetical protein [archaeon]